MEGIEQRSKDLEAEYEKKINENEEQRVADLKVVEDELKAAENGLKVIENGLKVFEDQKREMEAMETQMKITEDQLSSLKDVSENIKKSEANLRTQVRDLTEAGLKGYSEGFQKAVQHVQI